ncbi:hypothetical protein VTK73DRAFT_2979 [Phialemonium thermophilum]|uniref:BZIP domain-containing protein n=1 Tax=Phialemonium thermophilum TaxID=223376 RepID=A0ABR3Y2E9_9PEZI
MSQREPAPRPSSRSVSITPPSHPFSSPLPPVPSSKPAPAHHDAVPSQTSNSAGIAVTKEQKKPQSTGSRTSGVHQILNPLQQPDPFPPAMAQTLNPSKRAASPPGESVAAYGTAEVRYKAYDRQSQQQQQQWPQHAPSVQPTHQLLPPSSGPKPAPVSRRGSPTFNRSYSPLGTPRRILTPKSPRTASLAHAALRRESPNPPLPGQMHTWSASNPQGPLHPGASMQFQSHASGPALPPTAVPTSPLPGRSMSQPIVGHGIPTSYYQTPQPPGSRPPMLHSAVPFASTASSTREHQIPGPVGDVGWAQGMFVPRTGGPVGSTGIPIDGQHVLTIMPSHGEEILVPIDTHQGSRQMDEKRHRNANASARFRMRKKEKDKNLEASFRALERRVQELEVERDHYRNERNRLRDIIIRTPGISQWAEMGPPSPTTSKEDQPLFAAEGNAPAPGSSAPSLTIPAPSSTSAHAASMGTSYSTVGSSTLERPSRRRRTESEPHFPMPPSHAIPQPATLPPLQPSAYGSAQPTYGVEASRPARLPPLRLDQPPHPLPPEPASTLREPYPPAPSPLPTQADGAYPTSHTRQPFGEAWTSESREGQSRQQ